MGDTLVSQPGTMHSTSGLTASSKVPAAHHGAPANLAVPGMLSFLVTAWSISLLIVPGLHSDSAIQSCGL